MPSPLSLFFKFNVVCRRRTSKQAQAAVAETPRWYLTWRRVGSRPVPFLMISKHDPLDRTRGQLFGPGERGTVVRALGLRLQNQRPRATVKSRPRKPARQRSRATIPSVPPPRWGEKDGAKGCSCGGLWQAHTLTTGEWQVTTPTTREGLTFRRVNLATPKAEFDERSAGAGLGGACVRCVRTKKARDFGALVGNIDEIDDLFCCRPFMSQRQCDISIAIFITIDLKMFYLDSSMGPAIEKHVFVFTRQQVPNIRNNILY